MPSMSLAWIHLSMAGVTPSFLGFPTLDRLRAWMNIQMRVFPLVGSLPPARLWYAYMARI